MSLEELETVWFQRKIIKLVLLRNEKVLKYKKRSHRKQHTSNKSQTTVTRKDHLSFELELKGIFIRPVSFIPDVA